MLVEVPKAAVTTLDSTGQGTIRKSDWVSGLAKLGFESELSHEEVHALVFFPCVRSGKLSVGIIVSL